MTRTPFPASLRFLGGLAGLWVLFRAPVLIAEFAPSPDFVPDVIAATRAMLPEQRPQHASLLVPLPPPLSARLVTSPPAAQMTPPPVLAVSQPGSAPDNMTAAGSPGPRSSNLSTPTTAGSDAGLIAEAAYAELRAGNRRAGARGLDHAIAEGGSDPRLGQWRADRALLDQRWSGSAYALLGRGKGDIGLAGAPQLGGSQLGARLGWRIDPLARRPVDVVARVAAPVGRAAQPGTQAAIGVEWSPVPGLAIAAERAIAANGGARNAWIARISGGTNGRKLGGGMELDSYAQAGVIGARRRDPFIDAIARISRPVPFAPQGRVKPGVGLWAAAQPGAQRLDVGPSLGAEIRVGDMVVSADLDWRWRVAGNARPDSGPAVTIRTGF